MYRFSSLRISLILCILTSGVLVLAQDSPRSQGTRDAYLGVTVHPGDHPLARQLGVTTRQGAVVTRMVAGGPGEQAGLRMGDVIVKFGSTPIASVGDLESLAARLVVGRRHRVEFYRGKSYHFVELTVGRRPGAGTIASPPPSAGPAPIADGERGMSLRCSLFPQGPGGTFAVSLGISGLTGEFAPDSPEMSYYRFRWLPGKPEIADIEGDLVVPGNSMSDDPATYTLVTGYQADGVPVTVRIACPEHPEPADGVRNGSGPRYRVLGRRIELLQFAGHEAPGLYSIDITQPSPGTFTWMPRRFDSHSHVCGPQVVGVYVIYQFERKTYEGGQVVETRTLAKPYRVAWLFLGCPGEQVEKDNRMYTVGDPRRPAGAGGERPPVAAGQRWYRHVEGAYRIGLPGGWTVVEKYRGDVRDPECDTLYSPDRLLKLICGRIHEEGQEPEQSLEKYLREKLASDKGAKLHRFALGGMPAVRVSYPLSGGKGHVSRVSFVNQGKRYVVNAVMQDNSDMSRLDPRVEAIFKTLEVQPPDPRTDTLAESETNTAERPQAASGPAAAITSEPSPDEARAMEVVRTSPTAANTAALAKIRARHGCQLLEMAREKRDAGLFRLAMRYSLSATELAPEEPLYWFLLAQVCSENQGQPLADRLAIESAEQALALAPGDNRIRVFLGQTQFRQGQYDAALGHFEHAVQREATLVAPPLVAMMTAAYVRDLQTARGRAFLAKLLADQPEAHCARLALAILLHHDGKDADARAELGRVADSPGASPENREYARQLPVLWSKEGSP